MIKQVQQFQVSPQDASLRLDIFLHQKLPQLSRSQIKNLIIRECIVLDGQATKPSHTLKSGEKIKVEIPKPEALELEPEAIPLEIFYEDLDLLVLNKPAELVVHPGAGVESGTLVHAILHHCSDLSGIGGKLRPGIVHRLDKGTSGIMVVAKNDLAHQHLSDQFKNREVKKKYQALVWGEPKQARGILETPIGRSSRDRKKISAQSVKPRSAQTQYQVLQSWQVISLLELSPRTGRTHQLRVHLTELGHSIVGDPTYGKGLRRLELLPNDVRAWIKKRKFQLLHASELNFTHPRSGKILNFKAPIRKEMKELIRMIPSPFGGED